MQKMISLIVPCWNISRFLPDFLAGVDKQIYKNFEVIFVDDGSTDNTVELLQEFCKEHSNAYVVKQMHAGPSAARNAGVKLSHGEFLAFADADDMLAPEFLQTLADGIDGVDISICAYKWVREKVHYNKIKPRGHGDWIISNTEKNICKLLSAQKYSFCVWNKLYRKSIFEEVGGFDNSIFYGEDLAFNFRYFSKIKSVRYCKRKVYFYRHRKGGEVRRKFNTNFLTVQAAADKMIKGSTTKKIEYHARGFKCLSCAEMLLRIYGSKFNDRQIIQHLLSEMKANRKAALHATAFSWARRVLVPGIYPILKLMMRKRLKQQKNA